MNGRSLLLASVLAVTLLSGCGDKGASTSSTTAEPASSTPTAATATRPTPVIDQDFPDPDVILVGRTYYAYATEGNTHNIQVARSADLRKWEVLPDDALPALGAWATRGRTWAPGVAPLAGGRGYVMYYTAHSLKPDVQCVGVATARRPEGPFAPVGPAPLVCPAKDGGAIDAASFVDRDGRRYLLWKNDGNCCGKDTWLHLQPLSADGLRLAGPARQLLRQDRPWEGNLVEAPTLWRHGRRYYLFYSANDYSGARYATGYAVADRLGGPYRKPAGPFLTTDGFGGAVIGPGGEDVLTTVDGSDVLFFHGWDADLTYRGMYQVPLRWEGGRPVAQR